jgi:hypothetical protein
MSASLKGSTNVHRLQHLRVAQFAGAGDVNYQHPGDSPRADGHELLGKTRSS